ncbi:MAG: hypothetical protein ACT4PX_08605 [Actinomycetota bacterium]
MLYAFGFDCIGVVVCDLYFEDPEPIPGQEGPEQGVRLEVRLLERAPLRGGLYSAQPIVVDQPVWRADLLESVTAPGTLDRAHHHPAFRGWEPGGRQFDDELTADPVGWVGRRLGDLGMILAGAGLPATTAGPTDADELRAAVPEITAIVERLLDRVRGAGYGAPGRAPAPGTDGARIGWL